MNNNHKKSLNYFEHLLISAAAVTECVSFSAFASLVVTLIGIVSFAVELKICAITEGIKSIKVNYFLAKTKLNTIEVLFSRAHVLVTMNLYY